MSALPPETLGAAYIAACPQYFEGALVEVRLPARGDEPARILRGGLSGAIVHQPGTYLVPAMQDRAPVPLVLVVHAPLVQLFVAGEVVFVTPRHRVRVHTDPSQRLAEPRPLS